MRLYLKSIKQQIKPIAFVGVFYLVILLFLIIKTNADSMVYYKISPYDYASGIVDFFFALIVSIPFSYYTFYMKKDGFLNYVSLRISEKKYINTHFAATVSLCFIMVFAVNVIAVVFSSGVADIAVSEMQPTLSGYILGQLQMDHPVFFGILWSLQKAFIGSMICLFAQIIALYINNLFLAMFLPFVYVALENFLTSILGLSQFSLTTTFVLNRLKPTAMKAGNLIIAICIFLAVIVLVWTLLRGNHENQK